MGISVLASIYSQTTEDELSDCLHSLQAQILPADEIILVYDGPIARSVDKCVQEMTNCLPIQTVCLERNQGLGIALRVGLRKCSHEFVARVDSDDKSVPNRFLLQVQYLMDHPDVSVVGGAMREWYSKDGALSAVERNGPLIPDDMRSRAKKRNPLNHPSVMFRKDDILTSGGYQDCPYFEDYHLWARLLISGYQLANIPEVIVETTIDNEYFRRRGGFGYIVKEVAFVSSLLLMRFFTIFDALIFLITRIPIRLLPLQTRIGVYTRFLR